MSLSTSGTGEQCFWSDKIRYSHIVDPRTGWPLQSISQVSVVTPSGARWRGLGQGVSAQRRSVGRRAQTGRNWGIVSQHGAHPAAGMAVNETGHSRNGDHVIRFSSRSHCLPEDHLANPAFPLPLLRPRLCRSGERRLCQAPDAAGPWHERHRLRPGRGHLLPRLLHLRGPRQPDAPEAGRAALARAAHDGLGRGLRLHPVREGRDELLRDQVPARHRGIGLLSRRDPVSDLLVHAEAPRADGRPLHERGSRLDDRGRADLRLDPGKHERRGDISPRGSGSSSSKAFRPSLPAWPRSSS